MARKARAAAEAVEEIKAKDFKTAVRLYREDIKPANSGAAERNQEASTAYKQIKKHCNLQPDAARKVFQLFDRTEDAKRDDWFRCFVGLANEFAGRTVLTFHSNDLVDMAEVSDRYARPKPTLVTAGPVSDGSETDLADAAEEFEASEEELAQQAGRAAPRAGSVESVGGFESPLH